MTAYVKFSFRALLKTQDISKTVSSLHLFDKFVDNCTYLCAESLGLKDKSSLEHRAVRLKFIHVSALRCQRAGMLDYGSYLLIEISDAASF